MSDNNEQLEGMHAIRSIIAKYREIGMGYTDVAGLLYLRKQLVTNLSFYVELVIDSKTAYDSAYAERKSLFAEKKNLYLSQGANSAVSVTKAEQDIKEALGNEKYLESKVFEGRQNVDIFKEVSDTMKQHISYLKFERQNPPAQN